MENSLQLPLPKKNRPLSAFFPDCLLEAQTLEHAELDYQAVMASREHLREWCADTWPEDDFSLEENREDLSAHIKDAETGFAYGYTVFTPKKDAVIGSVYLYPSLYFANRYRLSEEDKRTLENSLALVDYWLIPGTESIEAHTLFLGNLLDWLRNEWGYSLPAWASRPGMKARRQRYEALRFRCLARAESKTTPGWIQYFHLPADPS